jgi:prepilin-type N-terminal cleavage/methylation domain-containing protein
MIEVMNLSIKRGFTLIELLVVITIIGILVAVVFPNFSESRDEARNRGLQAEIKEMQLSIELYKSQFGRYPAEGACGGDSQACGGQGYIANFTDFMYPARLMKIQRIATVMLSIKLILMVRGIS